MMKIHNSLYIYINIMVTTWHQESGVAPWPHLTPQVGFNKNYIELRSCSCSDFFSPKSRNAQANPHASPTSPRRTRIPPLSAPPMTSHSLPMAAGIVNPRMDGAYPLWKVVLLGSSLLNETICILSPEDGEDDLIQTLRMAQCSLIHSLFWIILDG